MKGAALGVGRLKLAPSLTEISTSDSAAPLCTPPTTKILPRLSMTTLAEERGVRPSAACFSQCTTSVVRHTSFDSPPAP